MCIRDSSSSINTDKRLFEVDIKGSVAYAETLKEAGLISSKELSEIKAGLKKILEEIKEEKFTWESTLEDVHMNIESRLVEIAGSAAKKIHTGRSRNDQVATDTRLWTKKSAKEIQKLIKMVMRSIFNQADKHQETIIPGFTHLQMAQPITWGHHMMAYVEMFSRDLSRFTDARDRMNECPLGSAALAGTSFPINRETTSSALDFKAPSANSLDA